MLLYNLFIDGGPKHDFAIGGLVLVEIINVTVVCVNESSGDPKLTKCAFHEEVTKLEHAEGPDPCEYHADDSENATDPDATCNLGACSGTDLSGGVLANHRLSTNEKHGSNTGAACFEADLIRCPTITDYDGKTCTDLLLLHVTKGSADESNVGVRDKHDSAGGIDLDVDCYGTARLNRGATNLNYHTVARAEHSPGGNCLGRFEGVVAGKMSALLLSTDCAVVLTNVKATEALAGPKRPADLSPSGEAVPGGEESLGTSPSCKDGCARIIDKDGSTFDSSVVETIVKIGKNLV